MFADLPDLCLATIQHTLDVSDVERMVQALRFGNDRKACQQAIGIGFQHSGVDQDEVIELAQRQLDMACPHSAD